VPALAPLGGRLPLAPYAGLLVALTAPGLGEDAVLLHLPVEAPQRRFEALVLANDYLYQVECAPSPEVRRKELSLGLLSDYS